MYDSLCHSSRFTWMQLRVFWKPRLSDVQLLGKLSHSRAGFAESKIWWRRPPVAQQEEWGQMNILQVTKEMSYGRVKVEVRGGRGEEVVKIGAEEVTGEISTSLLIYKRAVRFAVWKVNGRRFFLNAQSEKFILKVFQHEDRVG